MVTNIAMKPVITNSLKALWQDVLCHSSDELEGGDMDVRVVMSGSSCGLQDDNVADVECDPSASVENVFETGIARSHEWTEQCGVSKKPDSEKLSHGQYHMAVRDARQQSSRDKVCPAVDINLGTGKTKAGLAGERNSAYFSAGAASVLNEAHLVGIAAAQHFIDSLVVVRMIKAWMVLFECIPMDAKDSFERVLIDAFHGCSLRTTITELAK